MKGWRLVDAAIGVDVIGACAEVLGGTGRLVRVGRVVLAALVWVELGVGLGLGWVNAMAAPLSSSPPVSPLQGGLALALPPPRLLPVLGADRGRGLGPKRFALVLTPVTVSRGRLLDSQTSPEPGGGIASPCLSVGPCAGRAVRIQGLFLPIGGWWVILVVLLEVKSKVPRNDLISSRSTEPEDEEEGGGGGRGAALVDEGDDDAGERGDDGGGGGSDDVSGSGGGDDARLTSLALMMRTLLSLLILSLLSMLEVAISKSSRALTPPWLTALALPLSFFRAETTPPPPTILVLLTLTPPPPPPPPAPSPTPPPEAARLAADLSLSLLMAT